MDPLTVPYKDCCRLRIQVEMGDTTEEADVVLDTAFVNDTYGLVLPTRCLPESVPKGVTELTLANGDSVTVDTVAGAQVVRIGAEYLGSDLVTAVAFLDGPFPILGMRILKDWVMELDGPKGTARLELPY